MAVGIDRARELAWLLDRHFSKPTLATFFQELIQPRLRPEANAPTLASLAEEGRYRSLVDSLHANGVIDSLFFQSLARYVSEPEAKHEVQRVSQVWGFPLKTEKRDWDVFISYTKANKDFAEELARDLHDAGLLVFFDQWYISPGDLIWHCLEQAMASSKTGVVVVSNESMKSPHVRHELATMLHDSAARKRKLIAVTPPGVSMKLLVDIEPSLEPRKFIEFTEADYREQVRELALAINGTPKGAPQRRGWLFWSSRSEERGLPPTPASRGSSRLGATKTSSTKQPARIEEATAAVRTEGASGRSRPGLSSALGTVVLTALVITLACVGYLAYTRDPAVLNGNALHERGGPGVTIISPVPVRELPEAVAEALLARGIRAEAASFEPEDNTNPDTVYVQLARPFPGRRAQCDEHVFTRANEAIERRRAAAEAEAREQEEVWALEQAEELESGGNAEEEEMGFMAIDEKIAASDVVICLPSTSMGQMVWIAVNPRSDFGGDVQGFGSRSFRLEAPLFPQSTSAAEASTGVLATITEALEILTRSHPAPAIPDVFATAVADAVTHVHAAELLRPDFELHEEDASLLAGLSLEEVDEADEVDEVQEWSRSAAERYLGLLRQSGSDRWRLEWARDARVALELNRQLLVLLEQAAEEGWSLHVERELQAALVASDVRSRLLVDQRRLVCGLADSLPGPSARPMSPLIYDAFRWSVSASDLLHGPTPPLLEGVPSAAQCERLLSSVLMAGLKAMLSPPADWCMVSDELWERTVEYGIWRPVCLASLRSGEHPMFDPHVTIGERQMSGRLVAWLSSDPELTLTDLDEMIEQAPLDVAITIPIVMLKKMHAAGTLARSDVRVFLRGTQRAYDRYLAAYPGDRGRHHAKLMKSSYFFLYYYYSNIGGRKASLKAVRKAFAARSGQLAKLGSCEYGPDCVESLTIPFSLGSRRDVQSRHALDEHFAGATFSYEVSPTDAASSAIDALVVNVLRLHEMLRLHNHLLDELESSLEEASSETSVIEEESEDDWGEHAEVPELVEEGCSAGDGARFSGLDAEQWSMPLMVDVDSTMSDVLDVECLSEGFTLTWGEGECMDDLPRSYYECVAQKAAGQE